MRKYLKALIGMDAWIKIAAFAAGLGTTYILINIMVYFMDDSKASSYTQWNQNTWQVSDTLFTITAEGDTAKFILKQ